MKEVINYGEARRQQILKGFATADEAADEPIEKARHGVYADNAQNRRLQRVGQEYGQAAKEDPEGEGQEGGMPEGNVSLQNHARQASEEALTKVANDPQADPEMRKVATAELERRGVSVRAKNKNGDTSLRNGLADGDAKSASTFEGMGFRQMDDQDLQQYAGVEDASHAFIKQIGGDEDGFDLVVTKTSEGYRVDKYPYADVDNFESVTVKEIGDVEGAASKFGDPDAKGKGGKADAASLVDSFNAMAEGDADFDAKSFKSFVKEKGGKAVKEIADAIRKMPSEAGQSDLADDEIADMIENMFEEAGIDLSKKGQATLDKMRADSDGDGNVSSAEGLVQSFDDMAENDTDFDTEGFKSFVKQKGDAAAIKELAAAMKANPADTGGAQSDATDDSLLALLGGAFLLAADQRVEFLLAVLRYLHASHLEHIGDGVGNFDAAAKAEVKSAEKGAKAKADKAAKSSPEKDNAAADKFIKKTETGADPSEIAKMIAKNPEGLARALSAKIKSGDKNAQRAAFSLTALMDRDSQTKGVGKEIIEHPELKKFVDERNEAVKSLSGVYDPDEYRKKYNEQIEVFKRTQKGFMEKFMEIYGGNTEE